MSTPNPYLSAAAPELIVVFKAIQTFIANVGTDPTKWALTVPGALTVLIGTAQLQVPALVAAEEGVIASNANTTIAGWIAKLQAASGTPPAA